MGVTSKWFSDHELACPCCKVNAINPTFLARLNTIRELYGKPMKLSSAYRCPAYNASISQTGEAGPHTTGRAADVVVSGENAFQLLDIAIGCGISGLGIAQRGPFEKRYLHLDDVPDSVLIPRPRVWSY